MKKKKITTIHIPTTDFSMKKNNLSSLMMTLHKWSAWDQTSSLLSKDNDGWQINAPHTKKSYNDDFSCFDDLCNRLIRPSSN